MEGVFSLPYSEYEVIRQVQKVLKKQDGYSILIPTSRQQKGIDFAILNLKNKKILTAQIKSSRSYIGNEANIKRNGRKRYRYNFWFSNFIDKYEQGIADVYILFGLYPIPSHKKSVKSDFWESIILVLTDNEMKDLLKGVKTKIEKKSDKFFTLNFNNEKSVFCTRGYDYDRDVSGFILNNRIKTLKQLLI